ncbi:hypothetical protein L210DRAFT_2565251 [Boletus edulis BED1]|uniref:Uncharacterized protein n=1 Tax=Boletus edulis BED1 TaxID=1328754 RepID=A0AAD4BN43_BOLED|nr:hypothetical protein L210DRAFT_2565251 [Boletus edulis BED1]
MCNPRDRITATQALDHDYFWTDPLPADPKTLPVYESSHEFDKRGRRNNIPPPPHGYLPPRTLTPHPSARTSVPRTATWTRSWPWALGESSTTCHAYCIDAVGTRSIWWHIHGWWPVPIAPCYIRTTWTCHVHGHGRHHPSNRGERGERGSASKPPIHPSLPVRPAGLPPKPSVPLGTGRYERETERERERGRERGRERERGRHGGSTTGGGNTHGGNGAESGRLSGGLPCS